MTFQLLATLHPRRKPSKPKICRKMPSWTPQEGPRRAQDSPRWAQKGTTNNDKIMQDTFWSPLGAIVGPSWVSLGSTWLFQAHLEANMASKLLFSSPQDHKKTSKQPLCKLSQSLLPPEIGKKNVFLWFCVVFDISAFGHLAPQYQAFQTQNMPQDALLDPTRRAKEGPR